MIMRYLDPLGLAVRRDYHWRKQAKQLSLALAFHRDPKRYQKVGISHKPLCRQSNEVGISHPKVYVWVLLLEP